jgi:hypothetical protein
MFSLSRSKIGKGFLLLDWIVWAIFMLKRLKIKDDSATYTRQYVRAVTFENWRNQHVLIKYFFVLHDLKSFFQ